MKHQISQIIKGNKHLCERVKGDTAMTLRPSILRFIIVLFFVCSIGMIASQFISASFSGEYGSLSIVHRRVGMLMMGISFGTALGILFNPTIYTKIVLTENTLTAPCKPVGFSLPHTITVNLSDINLTQSKITFVGDAKFRTNNETTLFIYSLAHSRKSICKLFDEITKIKGHAL